MCILSIFLKRLGRPVLQSLDFRLIGWRNILNGRFGLCAVFRISFGSAEVLCFGDDRSVVFRFRLVRLQNSFTLLF